MKNSLILSALIVVLSIGFYFWKNDSVRQEKERRGRLVEEALALGMTIGEHKATKSITGINDEKSGDKEASEWKPLFEQLLGLFPDENATEEALSSSEKDFFEWIFSVAQLDEANLIALLEEIKRAPAPYESLLSKEELLQGILTGVLQEKPEVGLPLLYSKFADVFEGNEEYLDDLLRMAMENWGQSDADGAEKWLAENQSSFSEEIGQEIGDQLLLSRITNDPESAYEQFAKLSDEDLKRWQSDPFGRPHFLESLEEPGSLLNFLEVAKLAAKNAANSRERDELLKGVNNAALRLYAEQLASNSSKESLKMLEDPRLSPADRQDVLTRLSRFGQVNHREEWLAYASENAAPENRERVLERMVSNWTKNDFRATAEWIGKQPEGELRELATYSFARAVSPHEPDSAAEWAETLPVGPKRTEVFEKIREDWQKVDTEAAEELCAETRLGPE